MPWTVPLGRRGGTERGHCGGLVGAALCAGPALSPRTPPRWERLRPRDANRPLAAGSFLPPCRRLGGCRGRRRRPCRARGRLHPGGFTGGTADSGASASCLGTTARAVACRAPAPRPGERRARGRADATALCRVRPALTHPKRVSAQARSPLPSPDEAGERQHRGWISAPFRPFATRRHIRATSSLPSRGNGGAPMSADIRNERSPLPSYGFGMDQVRARQLADLSSFGDSWMWWFALLAAGGMGGALIGWVFSSAGVGLSIGFACATGTWLVLVLRARRTFRGYPSRHGTTKEQGAR